MKRSRKCIAWVAVCCLLLVPVGAALASQLVWVPQNPSFGGNSFNAASLLANAEAQNRHLVRPEAFVQPDPMAEFADNLNRALLSRLQTKIIDKVFGEETGTPLPDGPIAVGNYSIGILTTDGNITVAITDTYSGAVTSVSVPNL